MAQPELIARQIDQLMTAAARQGEWTVGAHQEFLHGVGAVLRESLGAPVSLEQPSSVLVDEPHSLPPDLPCIGEMDAFDHVLEVDDEPETVTNPALIAKARAICSTCIVRNECLENAESPPLLQPGMFGGKTMEERRPNWERNLEERHAALETLYKGIGQQLLDLVQATSTLGPLSSGLVSLRTAYFPGLEKIESPPIKSLSEVVHQALTDPKIIERAMMLLPINGRKVLERWATAVEQGQDPLWKGGAASTVWHNYTAAKRIVRNVLIQLHDGTFDYTEWAKSMASRKVQRSPLVFLSLLGEDIPDGDETVLRELALEKLNAIDGWNTRKGRRGPQQDTAFLKSILLEHYGLQGEALDMKELSERYGIPAQTINWRISKGLTILRSLGGGARK